MKIANIVTDNSIDVTDDINIVKDINDVISGIPTLVTSYKWLVKNYDEYDINDKQLDIDLFWTFAKTERRDIFNVDIEKFITFANKKLINDVSYIFIDLIHYSDFKLKKIIKKIIQLSNKVAFKHKNMIYIYGDNLIFGVDLDLLEYVSLNKNKIESKIKKICSVFLEDDGIFIEYKDNMDRLNHSVKYIPYLYSIKND